MRLNQFGLLLHDVHEVMIEFCLFIRDERSGYINDDDTKQIQTHFTQAEFVSLPTGSWAHAEQQQAFIDTVATFLTTPAS